MLLSDHSAGASTPPLVLNASAAAAAAGSPVGFQLPWPCQPLSREMGICPASQLRRPPAARGKSCGVRLHWQHQFLLCSSRRPGPQLKPRQVSTVSWFLPTTPSYSCRPAAFRSPPRCGPPGKQSKFAVKAIVGSAPTWSGRLCRSVACPRLAGFSGFRLWGFSLTATPDSCSQAGLESSIPPDNKAGWPC
jgi:hypothetical protein